MSPSSFVPGNALPSSPPAPYSSDSDSTGHYPVRALVRNSESDSAILTAIVESFIDPANVVFSTDAPGLTRYVQVKFEDELTLNSFCIAALSDTIKGTPFEAAEDVYQVSKNTVIFEFDSLTEAEYALHAQDQLASRLAQEGKIIVECISVEHFALLLNDVHSRRPAFNRYEGQIVVQLTASAHVDASLGGACLAIMSWMDNHLGSQDLRSAFCMSQVHGVGYHGYQFRLELDSRALAEHRVARQPFGGQVKNSSFTSRVTAYQPDGYRVIERPVSPGKHELARATQPLYAGGAVQGSHGIAGPRRTSFGSGRRDDQNNAIDVERIKRGLDVRTTVMLRNIPNQMTTYDLEKLLKQWAFGQFDFLYLRIDFANMCNVGYAFVNFDSPMTIVKVKQQLDTEGWPGHLGSNKRAAMSYATVQGVESLIEKFRNSSVMCEAPQCRPRLFYTADDVTNDPLQWHLQCQEKPFPLPNNEAKLARSRQNAETQGLYPAHSREEHRRGFYHNNFDRGNPKSYYGRLSYY